MLCYVMLMDGGNLEKQLPTLSQICLKLYESDLNSMAIMTSYIAMILSVKYSSFTNLMFKVHG